MTTKPSHGMEPPRSILRPQIVVIAALILGTAAFLAVRYFDGHRPALPEVERAELALVDGRLRVRGTVTPFTGIMTERYPDGTLQSRSSVSNGLLHGVSEGWHTNGTKQVIEHFEEGVSNGLRTKWYPNGAKLSEANIVQGRIEGVFRRWHENGTLAQEIPMKSGQPDGLSHAYYPNGLIKAEVRLRAGQVLEQKFWDEHQQVRTALADTQSVPSIRGEP